jgi:hypothetical protein
LTGKFSQTGCPGTVGREKEETMKTYENVGGSSAIVAYEIGDDSVTVKFVDGSVYLFSYRSAGSTNVEQMKKYATFGHGLHGFISRFVGKDAGSRIM